MNQNPYLHWAKKIRLTNWFLDCLAHGQEARRSRWQRLKATYNNVAPYTIPELAGAPLDWVTNQPGPSSYKSTPELMEALAHAEADNYIKSAYLAERANRPIHFEGLPPSYYTSANDATDRAVELIKESFGDAATFEFHADEILVTLDRYKL